MIAPPSLFAPTTQFMYDKVGFKPNPRQEPILACQKRFILVTGGEQGGKSVTASKKWLDYWDRDMERYQPCDIPSLCKGHPDGSRCDPTLMYWLVGKDYLQVEQEFSYISSDLIAIYGRGLVDASTSMERGRILLKHPRERVPRLRIEAKSANDPETAFARVAPHGIIACEAGQLNIMSYNRLRGRTAPRKGWLLLVGTIERSQPWFPQLKQQWEYGLEDRQSFELPAWDNIILYPGGRNDPEILALELEASDDFFMERIAGKPVRPEGMVFSEFSTEVHVRDVKHTDGETVYIFVDPGYGMRSAHAILACDIINEQVIVHDELYERGMTSEDMIDLCKKRPWWNEEKQLVIDPNYKSQHHANTSVEEEWQKHSGLRATGERTHILDGIERLKSFLKPDPLTGEPRVVIAPSCSGILSEFGVSTFPLEGPEYGQVVPYSWNLASDGMQVGKTPLDRYNHSIKALIYGITEKYGQASHIRKNIPTSRHGGKRNRNQRILSRWIGKDK